MQSFALYVSPFQTTVRVPGCYISDPDKPVKTPYSSSYAFNGLLHAYAASGIASPSLLMAFSQPLGKSAVYGMYYSSPFLFCDDPAQPCHYVPTSSACYPANGTFSGVWFDPADGLQPGNAHPGGSNAAYADGSAKFRRQGANLLGKTDYRTDPYSHYETPERADGAWFDHYGCHPLLFRPDFDFDFDAGGKPLEAVFTP